MNKSGGKRTPTSTPTSTSTSKPITLSDGKTKGRIIETSSNLTEAEQEDNPLNRRKFLIKFGDTELPKAFKTADTITEKDDLEFEIRRLRNLLSTFMAVGEFKGISYSILIDPLNQVVQIVNEQV